MVRVTPPLARHQRPATSEAQQQPGNCRGDFPEADDAPVEASGAEEWPALGPKPRISALYETPEDDVRAPRSVSYMESKPQASVKHRQCLREISHVLNQIMVKEYPVEVWEACDIQHPEEPRERVPMSKEVPALAAIADTIASGVHKAFGHVRSIRAKDQQEEKLAEMAKIGEETLNEDWIKEMNQDRMMAKLAQQCGWSFLDVEEVLQEFEQHAKNGCIDVNSGALAAILGELGFNRGDGQMDEIIDFVKMYVSQPPNRRRQSTHSSFHYSVADQLRSTVKFTELCLALARWMKVTERKHTKKHPRGKTEKEKEEELPAEEPSGDSPVMEQTQAFRPHTSLAAPRATKPLLAGPELAGRRGSQIARRSAVPDLANSLELRFASLSLQRSSLQKSSPPDESDDGSFNSDSESSEASGVTDLDTSLDQIAAQGASVALARRQSIAGTLQL